MPILLMDAMVTPFWAFPELDASGRHIIWLACGGSVSGGRPGGHPVGIPNFAKFVGLVIGVPQLVAGVYYLVKEKDDAEPKRIFPCGEAWDCISRYVYAGLQGGALMSRWTNDERMMVACCNDGTRPVSFKIVRIDEPETDAEAAWLAAQDFSNSPGDAYTG